MFPTRRTRRDLTQESFHPLDTELHQESARWITDCRVSWPRIRREQVEDEIVNRLGVVQGVIVFAWRWLNRERGVGIAKSGGVRRECIGGVGKCAEVGIQFTCEVNQYFDVVGFLVRFAVVNEECFDGFLCRLLAVVNCNVEGGIGVKP